MAIKKNLQDTPHQDDSNIPKEDTQEDTEDTFGSVFGGAFGGAFGGGFEVKFNSDGSTSKKKTKKEEAAEKKETPIRSSSRTFSVQATAPTAPVTPAVKRDSRHDSWVDEITRSYEKKTKVAESTPATTTPTPTAPKEEVRKTHVFTAPTPFRSKILTAEEKKAQAEALLKAKEESKNTPPVTAQSAGTDRGTAFAKTFLNKKDDGIYKKPLSPFARPFKKFDNRGSGGSGSFYKRTPRVKVKNAPTLKTRVSGKSHANKLELVKHDNSNTERRAPVVAVMGHVDHGKSTLLDYIRKSNIADREVGGITQKMSACEVTHNDQKITFLDTPGHEAFTTMRARGATAADIAILIVSAEDGVKPQTLDALKAITDAGTPYFIGASKIDRPGADIDKTKQSLAENSIFVEGYGGDISIIPFSGKTGEGVDDLLDMILLMADVAEISSSKDVPAECLVIEASRDKARGIQATLIIKNGTLKTGSCIVSGGEISPVRGIENFEGKQIKEAFPGQPVRIIGWVAEPRVGDMCLMAEDKATAELIAAEQKAMNTLEKEVAGAPEKKGGIPVNIRVLYGLDKDDTWTLPVVLKADSVGTLDALKQEIGKIKFDRINIRVIRAETGDINENDIKLAQGSGDSVVLGYNTKVDNGARRLADTTKTTVETFDIIYKLIEWITEEAQKRAPKIRSEESHSTLKVLKVFSANKHKQVLGGRVETGTITLGNTVKILRRDNEIGRGEIVELQQMRVATKTVEAGAECGLMVESKIEIVAGDVLSAVSFIER